MPRFQPPQQGAARSMVFVPPAFRSRAQPKPSPAGGCPMNAHPRPPQGWWAPDPRGALRCARKSPKSWRKPRQKLRYPEANRAPPKLVLGWGVSQPAPARPRKRQGATTRAAARAAQAAGGAAAPPPPAVAAVGRPAVPAAASRGAVGGGTTAPVRAITGRAAAARAKAGAGGTAAAPAVLRRSSRIRGGAPGVRV